MKYKIKLFLVLFFWFIYPVNEAFAILENLNQKNNIIGNNFTSYDTSIGICLFLELSSGPELGFMEQGSTGAVIEEFIKALEQDIIIITTNVLFFYLKLLIENNTSRYRTLKITLESYSLFQTDHGNFITLIPKKHRISFPLMGFNTNLKSIGIDEVISTFALTINLSEFKSIFNNTSNQTIKKFFYLSGHGTPLSWHQEPLIANLTLEQYKEFLCFLNDAYCNFLFISSCYAAGLNMINGHTHIFHKFPIVVGNLIDSVSSFYQTINFKKYFSTLNRVVQHITEEKDFLSSVHLADTIKKICGSSINNTPWIKLSSCDAFFMLNLNNHFILNNLINSCAQESTIEIKNSEHLLISSTHIEKPLKISGNNLPHIVSIIPGQSHHIFRSFYAENQTFYDLINSILKVPYEFKKVFFFKRMTIKKPKRKLNKFKIITIKNILVINHGTKTRNPTHNFFRTHELYFQKGTHYHRIYIPAGLRLGYLELESDIIPLCNKKSIIDTFLQSSKPSDQILKSIGEFP